jgi:pilus assembly protein CpaE
VNSRIRVVIVDDIPETREHLTKLLGFEADIEVVGTAASGLEAVEVAQALMPDVVLMDINMPGMDGIAASEQLSGRVPAASIVMMSVQGEADYLRRSMLAGAREFLVKPFSSDELSSSIRQVYAREREKLGRIAAAPHVGNGKTAPPVEREPGRIVTLFSPKGGVGRTTLAVNLAVAAAQDLGKRVALVDASFQFGDVGVLLNLNPKNKSFGDLLPELATGDLDTLDSTLISHSTGIRVLLAPPSPEVAELITTDHVRRVVTELRATHDLVVIDSWPWFHDSTIGILDMSDVILGLLTLEITNIKNIRLFLEVADQLGYPEDKVRLVLNRADSAYGIRLQDVENSIGRKIDHSVVSDGRTVVYALNRGVPFVASNREAQVSQDVINLAREVLGEVVVPAGPDARTVARKSLFAWR